MVAVVLAAGYATRLYPLTLEKPKALLDIGGKPMLDHILDKLQGIGAIRKTVIISNNKFYSQFADWKTAHDTKTGGRRHGGVMDGRDIIVINDGTDSENTRLGAIGDILFAIESLPIDDDIFVIAGDNFFTHSLAGFYDFFSAARTDCITVKKERDPELLKRVAIALVTPDSLVIDLEEKPLNPKSDLAVYAAYIYRRDTLPLFRVYLEEGNPKDAPGNFPSWLYKRKTVAAYPFTGDCYDIGTVESYRDICNKYSNA